MRKIVQAIFICLILVGCNTTKNEKELSRVISTPVPERAAGQTDVLLLKADPIPTVRVAFIGLGMRGPGAVERMTHIPGVEIVALCDIEKDRVEKANKRLESKGIAKAQEFYGDTAVWRQVTALPNVDLIYVATDWSSHAMIGIQAMKDGKHVAIEVPSAMTLDEIWGLVDTSEKTRKHCMQLENCVYDFFEMTTLNMVQQGVLGEILHGEGAYIHELKGFWDTYYNNWRMNYNRHHRGDLYPTHGLGPVCQAMNIHRGDKLNYLVCVDGKQISSINHIKETTGEDATDFKNGEHTSTLIKTEKGKTILIEHNVNSPRPYSRMYQLTGSKGFANKYPIQGFSFAKGTLNDGDIPNHENLDAHTFISNRIPRDDDKNYQTYKALMEKYKHPIAKELEETAKKVGGHGGMDFIMDYRLIYCLQNGLHLDMDVYDLAEWCSLIPLTALSLENNSAPVEIPDFTRGAWNKLDKLEFAK